MTIRKPVLFLFLFLSAIIAANTAYYLLVIKSGWHEQEMTQPVARKEPVVVPPPMESLGHGARMPTPEELEDEALYKDRQVTNMQEWVNDSSAEKRIAGVEQLSVYATPESEQILINTLRLDFDPEVRRAAAQSLSAFKKPSEKAVNALLAALQDDSDEVQIGALNTLMKVARKMGNGSADFKSLLANLSNQAKAKRMKPGVRQSLRAFLQDQQPSPLSFH